MNNSALRVLATLLLILPGLSSAGSFTWLGVLDPSQYYGFNSNHALSGDGLTVVSSGVSAQGTTQAWRWTSATGIVSLGDVPGEFVDSYAKAVSFDGSVIVGYGYGGPQQTNYPQAFRWTAETGMHGLGSAQPDFVPLSTATGVSADGSVIVGTTIVSGCDGVAFRWTSASGFSTVNDSSGHCLRNSEATGVSADGTTIVGNADLLFDGGNGYFGNGFISQDGGPALILPNVIRAVSGDGSLVVGHTNRYPTHPFAWNEQSGTFLIPEIDPDPDSLSLNVATAVSADGQTIVGLMRNTPFVWTAAGGTQSVLDILASQGVIVDGRIWNVTGVSADGKVIIGDGDGPGGHQLWIANIAPVPIPAAVYLFGSALGLIGVMRHKT
jgi:uncharacterized membrane protein